MKIPTDSFYINAPPVVREAVKNHAIKLGFKLYYVYIDLLKEYEYIFFSPKFKYFHSCVNQDHDKSLKLISLEEFFSMKPEPEFAPKVGEHYRHENGNVYVLAETYYHKFVLMNLKTGVIYAEPGETALKSFGDDESKFTKVEVEVTVTKELKLP